MNAPTLPTNQRLASRKQHLLKMLLMEVLGVDPAQAEKDVEQIEPRISFVTTEKIAQFLRFQNAFDPEGSSLSFPQRPLTPPT